MPSFSYGTVVNNPYAQPSSSRSSSPISAEEALQQFLRTNQGSSAPAIATVRPVVNSLLAQPDTVEWTAELAGDLARVVLALLEEHVRTSCRQQAQQPLAEGSLAALFLLTVAMEEWSDEVMYAAVLQETADKKSSRNLLQMLWQLTTTADKKDDPLYQISFVGLTRAYQSMDRLEQYLTLDPCRPDVGWWLEFVDEDHDKWTQLAESSVNILLSSENVRVPTRTNGPYLPTTEQLQLAATSFLCILLKRDQLRRPLDGLGKQVLTDLGGYCLRKLQTLINPQLPSNHSSWHLPSALASVSLLSLLQWGYDCELSEYDGIVNSTTLVENISLFSFGSLHGGNGHHESPRWTYDEGYDKARPFGLDVVLHWKLSGGDAWSVFLKCERYWLPAVEQFWNDAVNGESQNMAAHLPRTVILHHTCRLISRGALFSILQRWDVDGFYSQGASSTNLLTPIFELFQSNCISASIQALRFARTLLSDRRSMSTHDEVSRVFWNWIDDEKVRNVISLVLRLIPTTQDKRPLLLSALDLVDTILQDQGHCDTLLMSMTAETVEQIITIVQPKKVKHDFRDPEGDWGDLSLDTDTPPANNLSRMDENSICIEQEDESIPIGVDVSIQLAAATLLARLGYSYSTSTDEGIHLLKSRICTVVNNFVTQFMSCSVDDDSRISSFDLCKRLFRLQLAVATSENEDFVATTLFSRQMLERKQLQQTKNDYTRLLGNLRAAEQKIKGLEEQNEKLHSQNHSQVIVFRREMSRVKENSNQDARQLVSIHATERSNAETRASECFRKLEETESQLKSVIVEVEESQRTVLLTKEELQAALTKTAELENENKDLSRQIELEESKARELEEEMLSQTEKLDSLFRTRQELEDEIHQRDQAIEDREAANEALRGNLEELFGDMVRLSTIYETKENEVVQLQRSNYDEVDEFKRKLRVEKERNDELNSTLAQLQEVNDKLVKKLAKYKERLEDERRERQEEANRRQEEANRRKKNGPVSYINQLHQSTSVDRSRDLSSTRKESGSSKNRSRTDKENSYTAQSQRRKF